MKKTATANAPGRIDFMGGVADYSGSLVLQLPIQASTSVTISRVDGNVLEIKSGNRHAWAGHLREFVALLPLDLEVVRDGFDQMSVPRWGRYVLGCVLVYCRAKKWQPESGLRFEIRSTVPESMGVSSSASLEVATLRALGKLTGARWSRTELARLGQLAENEIVGAPCGLMDQLTVHHGKPGCILPILCRPDKLHKTIDLPSGITVVGWPSGVRHAVSGSPYMTARTATFMGKRIFEERTGQRWEFASEVPPALYERTATRLVPEIMTGAWFRKRFGEVVDKYSTVSGTTRYNVRAALGFPVAEHFRCQLVASLLANAGTSNTVLDERLQQIGTLMVQSHSGYTDLGLGSPETDRMLDALVDAGPKAGIYGGRVSGGGSGGTVAVLLKRSALPRLRRLNKQLHGKTSKLTHRLILVPAAS